MKRIFLLAFSVVMGVFTFAQTVVESPKIGMSTASNVKLNKVELLDSETILWFHVRYTPGNWIFIPDQSFIQPVGSPEKLFIVSADGIPVNERFIMPESGEVSYKLVFPKIDAAVAKLDYGEANDGGSWFIYDIQLKPELFQSVLPEKLSGNWFRNDNAQWEISFFDSVAIYNSQVWKYGSYSEKDGIAKIVLKNDSKKLDIYTQLINDSVCMIGESPAAMAACSSQPDKSVIPADEDLFESSVFKVDTVTYRGYIRNFSPRYSQRTGMVYVNDAIVGDQISHLIRIAEDGSFEAKFPNCNLQNVLIRLPFFYGSVFLEPGKTTFQLFDDNSPENPVLFMGDCSRINTDLFQLKDIRNFNYQEMQEKILDFSPEQYKAWCHELKQRDYDELANHGQKYPLSAKAKQVKSLEFDYRNAERLLSYDMQKVSAWRAKNNIPRDQWEIDFKPEKPDSSYYDFLTSDFANNPLAVLTGEYYFFINRLMYLDILRENGSNIGLTTQDILDELKKTGYQLKPEEEEMAARLTEIDSPEFKKLQEEFQEKYGEQAGNFQKNYGDKLQGFYQENRGKAITPEMVEEYLIGQHVELTEEDKAYLAAWKEHASQPLVRKVSLLQSEIGDLLNKFHTDHRSFVSGIFAKRRIETRNEKIQSVLGIQPGLATDVMLSQEYCRPIVSEMTPVSDERLKEMQAQVSTPFIARYIGLMNEATRTKIEENKKLAVANVNDVPENEGDNVFESIMKKYKGKVVYVDFWATWCGPCRSGIERIKPLKEEMKDENVAFVYITNQSSPKGTYDNMIPSISGEHYRVSEDEWNILSDKFKISGIPHYTLVGKDGQVINPHLGHMENSQLKTLLMNYINE
ncbi:TlpA family protein disulfide reductase [Gaoshiqia sediminis]|uniref:TlpA family protein disulfide reductase n=1 Tax=Gaoshiqia sediminis TaxID=2986998 RepID=A0AA41Y670_9BACT|nr:TlpA disulfide reductase family protein [Gaoshiqia sediminis]MCW0482664.1 TlpA family protein disulfide reductase [Gaoshiqia sediminis]